jgi:hypothetical protein
LRPTRIGDFIMKKLIFILFLSACFTSLYAQYWSLNGNNNISNGNFIGTTGNLYCEYLIFFKQYEAANFNIEGIGGGLTIAPTGNIAIHNNLTVGRVLNAQSANITGNTYIDGNVGIGIVPAQVKLDVAGSLKLKVQIFPEQ